MQPIQITIHFIKVWIASLFLCVVQVYSAEVRPFDSFDFAYNQPVDRVIGLAKISTNRLMGSEIYQIHSKYHDLMEIECGADCLSYLLFLASKNPMHTKQSVQDILELSLYLQKNASLLLLPVSNRRGYSQRDFMDKYVRVASNYWRDQPTFREFIERQTEPIVYQMFLDISTGSLKFDVSQREYLAFLQGNMLDRLTNKRRIKFFETLLPFFDDATEKRFYEGLTRLKDDEANKAFKDLGTDEFLELLSEESPVLGRFFDRVSWHTDLPKASDHLDRGFGGSAEQFLLIVTKVLEYGGVREIKDALSHLKKFIPQVTTPGGEMRGLVDMLTDQTLLTRLQNLAPRVPSLQSDILKTADALVLMNANKNEIKRIANEAENKCARDLAEILFNRPSSKLNE